VSGPAGSSNANAGLTIREHPRFVELVLDRREAANAFDARLYEALAAALERASAADSVACGVLAATGSVFCAGADLGDLEAALGDQPTPAQRAYDRLMVVVESFPKPLIAAVEGPAVGIGFTLLGHFDLIVASPAARFLAPFARLGLAPEAGSSATLPARLGPQRAARLLLAAEWLSVDEAERCGFVDRIVPPEEARATALELAERIGAMPLDSLLATKRLLRAAAPSDAEAAREREDAAFRAALARPETARRVRSALAATAERAEPER
jgi:enoyl-CoA hydratase/carnithine racemase